jgi:hypothetical protein
VTLPTTGIERGREEGGWTDGTRSIPRNDEAPEGVGPRALNAQPRPCGVGYCMYQRMRWPLTSEALSSLVRIFWIFDMW